MVVGRFFTLLFAASLPVFAALSGPALAESKDKDGRDCRAKIGAQGRPNTIQTVASLSALRLWSQMAESKYGVIYSMWHNAQSPSVKCEKKGKAGIHLCFASGKPCRATTSRRAAKKTD